MSAGASVTAPAQALGRRTVRGAAWAFADQAVVQVVQLVLYTVVARLLGPGTFGVVAMAAVFIGFATLLGQLGLEAALVQARKVDAELLDAVFWAGLTANTLIGAAMAAAAPAIAGFYREPQLVAVVWWAALSLPLAALGSPGRATLTRLLDFRRLFLADVAGLIAGAAATGVLVGLGLGPASVAAGTAARAAVQSLVVLRITRWRPGRLQVTAARRLGGYSVGLLGFNVVNYWARNVDNLLIGRVLGAVPLAFYERSYLLMLYPISQIGATLGRVVISSMSRLADDVGRASTMFLVAVRALAMTTAPAMLGLAACAEPFVTVVFGTDWLPMVAILRVLALVGAVQALVSPVGYIYQSQARTRLMLVMGAATAAVLVTGIVTGILLGSALAVAVCYAVAAAVSLYPTIEVPYRLLGLHATDLVRWCGPSLLAASVMAGAVATLEALLPGTALVRLLAGVVLGVPLYLALLVRMEPAGVAHTVGLVRGRLAGRRDS